MGRKPEGSTEKILKKLGKKIDALIVELNEVKNQAKEGYADNIDELKRNGKTLKKELNDLKDSQKGRWKEVGDNLKNAFNTAFTKKKKH